VVQISDVHLGHIVRSEFLTKVVTTINTLKPEMVFITGDLYDGMDGSLEHLIDPINKLVTQK
jgi:predicted MPP superfamily phosphohydrolase